MKQTGRTFLILTLAMLACSAGTRAQRGQSLGNRSTALAMSGTYELESTRGGDPRRAAETATRSLPPGQRDRAYQSLMGRLQPPQTFSIDRDGRTITIASSRGPRSSFEADGQTRNERGSGGQMIRTKTEIVGNRLIVSTAGGSRGSDFSVTFEPMDRGNSLRVTRRLDDDDLARPVTIESYYRRTGNSPRWDVYTDGPSYAQPYRGMPATGPNAAVPGGTRLEATLNTPLSMRGSRNGETFDMTVRAPAEFRGARIDGVVSRVNARNGRDTDLRVDFQTIEMGGRSSQFDAVLTSIRLADGTLLRLDAEGDVQEGNRRNGTVENGAVGAAIGAVIGALAGGGKGAAVGAAIGGTGGVILSQGHDQLELPRGSDVTLTVLSRYRQP